MGNKLEQLLNSLIQRWRVPFGEWYHRSPYKRVSIHKNYNKERTYVLFDSNNHSHWKVLRQVVSKESWLWQFVCEHWMIKTYMNIEHESRRHSDKKHTPVWAFDNQSYYYLIESALKDESELEQFLLDNIKL